MSRGRWGRPWSHLLVVVFVLLSVAATVGAAPASSRRVHHGPNGETDVTVCADETATGRAQCLAHERTDDVARSNRPARSGRQAAAPASTVGNNGAYDPAFLQSAYNAPSANAGAGRTVALVDAYDDPNAYADMGCVPLVLPPAAVHHRER